MGMKSLIISALLFSLSLSSLVNSQTDDSCNSNLILNGIAQFEAPSLQCNSVWESQRFILRYFQTRPGIWSFILSAPVTNAYIGIGFSSDGRMVGSSAMVGWIPASGAGVVKQYFLGAQSPGSVNPDQGSLQLVFNSTAIVSRSSRLYMSFQLNTTQPLTRLIYSVGPQNRLPSSDNRLTLHQFYIATRLDYASGQTTVTKTSNTLKNAHGVLNMLGWGILMLIGIIAARYFKHMDPIWFYAHVSIQTVAFILGVAGVITGFALENSLNKEVNTHKSLGIFILVLGSLQVVAFLLRPNKDSKVRKYWNWYHWTVGRVAIFLGIINIFVGIHEAKGGSSWNVGYGVTLSILVITAVVLEVRMWMRK